MVIDAVVMHLCVLHGKGQRTKRVKGADETRQPCYKIFMEKDVDEWGA